MAETHINLGGDNVNVSEDHLPVLVLPSSKHILRFFIPILYATWEVNLLVNPGSWSIIQKGVRRIFESRSKIAILIVNYAHIPGP